MSVTRLKKEKNKLRNTYNSDIPLVQCKRAIERDLYTGRVHKRSLHEKPRSDIKDRMMQSVHEHEQILRDAHEQLENNPEYCKQENKQLRDERIRNSHQLDKLQHTVHTVRKEQLQQTSILNNIYTYVCNMFHKTQKDDAIDNLNNLSVPDHRPGGNNRNR